MPHPAHRPVASERRPPFAWGRALRRTLTHWAVSYALLALCLLVASTGLISGRGDSAPMTSGYLLVAWVGLQGFFPLYIRADPEHDEDRVQDPWFLSRHLMSNAVGLGLLVVLAIPLARIGVDGHEPGSLVALLARNDPAAWTAFLCYAVGQLAWPTAAALFMLRHTARTSTTVLGVVIGLPVFLATLLGGLLLAAFQFLDAGADLVTQVLWTGAYAAIGLAVYAAVLLWFALSVRRDPLGPPPPGGGPFRAAVGRPR
ncbi:hypothetical protein M3686_03985 [Micrococcus luteus]|uniref:hypothetical protein n=1 Tax=Micrococcus luteus TaxID=1270 RepID=UPI002041C34E|nr:hypothetical protein [Micrococcus luteus]MCM3577302.1 hypothetical protein [Micrococcus luteus]MCV7531904.1 hypothetical protein [Micrococcus luteus]